MTNLNEPAPSMIGRTPLAAWRVVPTRDEGIENPSVIGIGAVSVRMVDRNGVRDVPAGELSVPTTMVDTDGVLRWDAATFRKVGEYMIMAARVAEGQQ